MLWPAEKLAHFGNSLPIEVLADKFAMSFHFFLRQARRSIRSFVNSEIRTRGLVA